MRLFIVLIYPSWCEYAYISLHKYFRDWLRDISEATGRFKLMLYIYHCTLLKLKILYSETWLAPTVSLRICEPVQIYLTSIRRCFWCHLPLVYTFLLCHFTLDPKITQRTLHCILCNFVITICYVCDSLRCDKFTLLPFFFFLEYLYCSIYFLVLFFKQSN